MKKINEWGLKAKEVEEALIEMENDKSMKFFDEVNFPLYTRKQLFQTLVYGHILRTIYSGMLFPTGTSHDLPEKNDLIFKAKDWNPSFNNLLMAVWRNEDSIAFIYGGTMYSRVFATAVNRIGREMCHKSSIETNPTCCAESLVSFQDIAESSLMEPIKKKLNVVMFIVGAMCSGRAVYVTPYENVASYLESQIPFIKTDVFYNVRSGKNKLYQLVLDCTPVYDLFSSIMENHSDLLYNLINNVYHHRTNGIKRINSKINKSKV